MYVCMYVRMCVCVCVCVCMYGWMDGWMYDACMYVCMYGCMDACMDVSLSLPRGVTIQYVYISVSDNLTNSARQFIATHHGNRYDVAGFTMKDHENSPGIESAQEKVKKIGQKTPCCIAHSNPQ